MTPASWQELIGQLKRLPGGAPAAIPDFFAGLIAALPGDRLAAEVRVGPGSAAVVEAWPLRDGGQLSLFGDERHGLHLVHQGDRAGTRIADLPGSLLTAALAEAGVSPLVLALLAIAVGHVEDERRLKQSLPGIDAAAKDLMLMTVCRLCG